MIEWKPVGSLPIAPPSNMVNWPWGITVICAFCSWEGYNYEDAIVISSRLVENDKFTSIHIEKHEVEARDTKLGPEEITRDIPNVGEESLRELDEYRYHPHRRGSQSRVISW